MGAPPTTGARISTLTMNDDDTYGLEPVLSVAEVATFLHVNPKTLYEAVRAGDVPARRVGRRVVILRDALLDWLRSNGRVPPSRRRTTR
jgi:excisionase family DNA binding protein